MSKSLTWKTEKRKLSSLKEHPNNPRSLSIKAHNDLKKSFEKFDYVELVAVNTDGTILAGHQRCFILTEMGKAEDEIEVRIPSRKLTEKEAKEYLLRSNKNIGEWDFDILANNYEVEDLLEWGFQESDLQIGDWAIDSNEEIKEKEFDESITDNLELIAKFIISIPNEIASSFNNQLDELLLKFPQAKLDKKI